MYTHKDTRTHTQTQCCRDHHFVSVLAYPLSCPPPFLFLYLPQCVRSVRSQCRVEHSSSGDDRTAVNLKTHNGNT